MSLRVGWALCGSFCTLSQVTAQMAAFAAAGYTVTPVFSPAMCAVDTRFGKALEWRERVAAICGREVLTTLADVEPLGPRDMVDVMVVAPCTGSTLAKLAAGDSSTPVTLAVKSHLRRERPVVIAVSTNDALAGSFPAIAALKNRRHYYFVPMRQDDPTAKPNSLVADFTRLQETVLQAVAGKQIQPLFLG